MAAPSTSNAYVRSGLADKSEISAIAVIEEEERGTSSCIQNATTPDVTLANNITEEDDEEAKDVFDGLDNHDDFPDGGWRAYSVAIGAFLGMLGGMGVFNSTGVIQAYIQTNQLADENVSTVSWIFSVFTFLCFFPGFIIGPVFDNYGSRWPLIIAVVLYAIGIFGSANATTVWQFILSFGICAGSAGCCTLTPIMGVISHWFLRRRATAVGFAMAGSSLGGVMYPLMLRSLIPKVGFVWAMRIMGFIACGLVSASVLLCRDRVEEIKMQKLARDHVEGQVITKSSFSEILAEIRSSIDLAQFKDKVYLLLVMAILFNELSLFLVLSYFTLYAIQVGLSDSKAYLMVTILAACGAPGRYLPGFLADKFGRFNVMLMALTMAFVSIFILWVPFAQDVVVLYVFAGCYGFFCGSTLSLTSVCIGQISKTENFGKRYGTGYCVVSFAILVGLPIGGAIIGDSASVTGYRNMTIFAGVTAAVGTVLFAWCRYLLVGFRLVKI